MKIAAIQQFGANYNTPLITSQNPMQNKAVLPDTFVRANQPSFQGTVSTFPCNSIETILSHLREYGQIKPEQIEAFRKFATETLPQSLKSSKLNFLIDDEAYPGIFGGSPDMTLRFFSYNGDVKKQEIVMLIKDGQSSCTLWQGDKSKTFEKTNDITQHFDKITNFLQGLYSHYFLR